MFIRKNNMGDLLAFKNVLRLTYYLMVFSIKKLKIK
ncbi:hypothetical protein BJ925_0384 [Rahnella aquatilis]|jgi:hypothetical protein|nr:hypothetical protein BJ925_0384 [Rahnella aquatilis]